MKRVHAMKSGDTFTYPSLFVNVQRSVDAKAMHIASNRGLSNIDGIVIDQLHYADIANDLGFNQQSLVPLNKSDMRLKLRLVDPTLHYLLVGNDEQKIQMLRDQIFRLKGSCGHQENDSYRYPHQGKDQAYHRPSLSVSYGQTAY